MNLEIVLLKVNNLVTGLQGGAAIVDGISFEIAKGETFALLGESGCGKSMTALSLMRLLPDGVRNKSGEIELGGVALTGLSEREMRSVRGGQMAMIFQEPGLSLNPVMTVGEQIAEVLVLHGRRPDAAILPPSQPSPFQGEGVKRRCIELLEQVGMPDAARRVGEYPHQLSGGMKQRVMIAMALAGNPGLLVADEPTTALDVTIQAQVLQLLRDTQNRTGMAMLLITHDLGVVAETAHRVGVMYAGQIVEQASREDLFRAPLHPYTQKLFAALPDARRRDQMLAAIPGAVPPLGSISRGCRFAPRCDRAWDKCRDETPQWVAMAAGQGVRCHLYAERVAGSLLPVVADGQAASGYRSVSGYSLPATRCELLKVSDLQVHFPIKKGILQRVVGQVKAVDGVSFGIPKGRTLALVGESGCGKTTLGKALLQLIKPTAGGVEFDGRELIGANGHGKVTTLDHGTRHARSLTPVPPLPKGEGYGSSLREFHGKAGASMQMVFQDPYASLNPRMRVAEILEEGMSALNIGGSSAVRQAQIDALLDRVGLARSAKWRYPHEFSGGQRQRIAIARALAVSPQLLICDEPTSALDVSVQAQILNLLKELQQELNLSYLFITHNLAVVEYLAHEVCVMYLGRIVERGLSGEVLKNPLHPYTKALLSAVPRIDGEQREYIRLEGDLPSPASPPPGCHFAPRCIYATELCQTVYPEAAAMTASHVVHCHLLKTNLNSG